MTLDATTCASTSCLGPDQPLAVGLAQAHREAPIRRAIDLDSLEA